MKAKREIAIELTETQIINKAQELAHLHAEAAEIQRELSAFTKERKEEIKSRTDRISQICRVIEAGTEIKTIECDTFKNFDRKTMQFFFEGKMVDERAMEESDTQENLFDAGGEPAGMKDLAEAIFDEKFPNQ